MTMRTHTHVDPPPNRWPDPLQPPEPARVAWLLPEFWRQLAQLPDLLTWQEHLLADQLTADLRNIVIEMMLALNGIQRPPATRHLNTYLGESQRLALQTAGNDTLALLAAKEALARQKAARAAL